MSPIVTNNFSISKKISGACMTLIFQWGHRVLGHGVGYSSRVELLLLRRLPTRCESFLLALIRIATEADNLALVVVRSSLSFTHSSSTPFLVVDAAARVSKYLFRSATTLVGPFSCWTWGACLSAPCSAPNCY